MGTSLSTKIGYDFLIVGFNFALHCEFKFDISTILIFWHTADIWKIIMKLGNANNYENQN